MAFSYLLNSADADIVKISRVRLELGDTIEDAGVLPGGGNLSNLEIQTYLDANDGDVKRATGDLCAVLSRRWSVVADVQLGPRRESYSQVAAQWLKQAEASSTGAGYVSFVAQAQRADGYTEYAESVA